MQNKKKFILYIFFSIITSGINIATYMLVYNLIIKNILIANVCAYAVSIIISFIINRRVVFGSNNDRLLYKFVAYLFMKITALFIDSTILYLLRDCMGMNNLIAKIISNCSTTFSNYSLSNLIFKNKE